VESKVESNEARKHGVYDISIEAYHSGEGVSRSSLMNIDKSPLHYWYECINPDRPVHQPAEIITVQDALDFGNALHTYVLEPDEFEYRYLSVDKTTMKKNTKIGKANFEDAMIAANSVGAQLISKDALKIIKSMSAAIRQHPQAPNLIEGAQFEKSIYWTDDDTGILCKMRPDIWQPNFIADLKTTADACLKEFERSVYKFGYHIQAGMIKEGFAHGLDIDMNNFIFIAVEKKQPYASAVYKLDEDALTEGVKEYKRLLQKLKVYLDADNWPSYPSTLISLPKYAFKKDEF
jgi:exodeoxyribonuclease VIII